MQDNMASISVTRDEFSLSRDATQGFSYNSPNWEKAWLELPYASVSVLCLKGHEENLFKKHMSFKNAKDFIDKPTLSNHSSLGHICDVDVVALRKQWKRRATSILEAIYGLKFLDDDKVTSGDEAKVGSPYVAKLLSLLVDGFPPVMREELHLEYRSPKRLVGGSIDLAVGSEENGRRPYINIDGKNMSVYLGCLGEAKSTDVRLDRRKNLAQTKLDFDDIKLSIQPMTEVMAMMLIG